MKKLILSIALIFTVALVQANDSSAYIKVMKAKIEQFNKSQSLEDLQASANAFERIAQKETTEWLPLYYAAFGYVKMGFNKTLSIDQKDTYLNKAINLVENAEEISPNNSELTALKGYALMGKLTADAANRGQTLSPQVMQTFGKAIQQNPENPRALYLMAQMEYGMAQFFGSGTEKACAMNQQSISLFEKNNSEGIMPSWGLGGAKAMLSMCQ